MAMTPQTFKEMFGDLDLDPAERAMLARANGLENGSAKDLPKTEAESLLVWASVQRKIEQRNQILGRRRGNGYS